ncbi:hypothetical protein JQ596_24550 [Bradyrhizobium manausense]|uniref:hypothetical protein n=1 Tax=Bradyrhizobium TaxID=374 RepID=UPI001BAC709C|nr:MULTISPECIES: hypothetical protein [Bradyrhizobium]MBR0828712.1 hypothetical protein [Bradyrhizobium manausense]UVO32583.1 hypothetical protein KUF59_19115 [Bradyrhizobium arachidis]
MRFILLAAGIGIMMYGGAVRAASGSDGNGNTTIVRDANGETVITQSGDPAEAEVRIEQEPGRTTVYRRSGGNTAIVTQSSGGPGVPDGQLEWLLKQLRR